eukprot:tig00020592_g11643.t1
MTLDEWTQMCEVLYFWDEPTAVDEGWIHIPRTAREAEGDAATGADVSDAGAKSRGERRAAAAAAGRGEAAADGPAGEGKRPSGAGKSAAGPPAAGSHGHGQHGQHSGLSMILQQSTRPLQAYRNFLMPAAQR